MTTHRMSFKGLTAKLGLSKSRLMEAVKLGLGAAVFPFAYGFLRSQVLMKASAQHFASGAPVELATRALSGVVLGSLLKGFVPGSLGGSFADGMAASAVGSTLNDLIAPMMNPAAAAAQSAVQATEAATGQTQVSGMNPLGRGLGAANTQLLFGVGTPDLSGAAMFNGANVAIEQSRGGMAGATVAFETPGFAGALT